MDGPREGRSRRRVRGTITRRQMEILALIAHGRTNAEIAEHFGISLSGAKYHVSEILSTLQVDTREEAAEWWRRENGLPCRLRRLVAALTGMGFVRWVAASGAVATVGASVFLVLITLAITNGTEPIEESVVSALASAKDCPVSEAICEFAERTQAAVQRGDVPGLLEGSPFAGTGGDPAGLGESIKNILRPDAGEPVLASIGCPILDGKPDCDQAFSFAFKASDLPTHDDGGILLLGFASTGAGGPILMSIAIPEAADRGRSALTGGTSAGCFSSGYSTRRFEGECIRTEFLMVQWDSRHASVQIGR